MSTQTIHSIMSRAVKEPTFRSLLFSDPETALAGYALTEAEAAALKNLTPETFDATPGDLETRLSKASLNWNWAMGKGDITDILIEVPAET